MDPRVQRRGDFDDKKRLNMRARDGYRPVNARAVDKDVLAEIKKKRIAHNTEQHKNMREHCWVSTGCLLTADGSQDAAVKPEGMSKWAPPAVGEYTTWKAPPPL